VQQVSISGVNVSWLFIAKHLESETAGAVERVENIKKIFITEKGFYRIACHIT
jgi:hypothetical protein